MVMTQKAMNITGWVLTAIIIFLFGMSASMKLIQNEAVLAQAAAVGISPAAYLTVGIIEIIAVILFAIPRTGVLGALLLVAYMGGAIVTHLEHQQPLGMAVTVSVLVWITAVIRFPELRQRLFTFRKI